MKGSTLLAAVVVTLSMASAMLSATAAEPPRVEVEVRPRQLYEGQSVLYSVQVLNTENPQAPQLKGFDDFDVEPAGEQSLDLRQVQIINGRRTEFARRGREFRYKLTPRKTGQLTIPGPVVDAGGKPIQGQSLTLNVRGPTQQDIVRLELSVDRPNVYPLQPFVVTLAVLLKDPPGRLAGRDPTSVQEEPPMLRIPWVLDSDLPEGLTPQVEFKRWLTDFVQRQSGGFGINNLAEQDFFTERLYRFRPKSTYVDRPGDDGKAAKYWRYEFARGFTASKPSTYTFGPVTLEGTFAAPGPDETRPVAKTIFAVAKAIAVAVKDVPQEGRPAGYLGVVGKFRLAADLVPNELKVGDPITLTLTLKGTGNLAQAVAPDLNKIPAVAARFKVYEATQKSGTGDVRFIYSLRPLAEGDDPFPPIEFAYFDVDAEKFVALRTAPIPIRVLKADRLSEDQIVSAARAGPASKEIEARKEGIFANIADSSALVDQSVHAQRWLAGLAGVMVLYVAVALASLQIQRRRGDTALLRRRAAPARARQRLAAAQKELAEARYRQGADLVQAALVGLVADVANLHEAGLTAKDVLQQVESLEVGAGLLDRAERLLDACDAARYAALAGPSSALASDAERLVEDLIEALRRGKKLR